MNGRSPGEPTSSQVTTGGIDSASISAPSNAAASTPSPAISAPNGNRFSLALRRSLVGRFLLQQPSRAHCIGLVLIFACIVALAQAPLSASTSPEAETAVNRVNVARQRFRGEPLTEHAALTGLAQRYLDEILASRELIPAIQTSDNATALYSDISTAIGEGGLAYRFNGLIVAYGADLNNALTAALATPANAPALLDPVMDIAGVAFAEVPAAEPWMVPPPGGRGEHLDLTGQTLIVIVTGGDFR